MTVKKRGRPVGVKNKPKAKQAHILSFEQQLEEWDRKQNAVDYKELSEKLQEALAKSYVEAENLERQIVALRNEVAARDVVITYLESRRT
jgi:predicted  nucleic acid-binding Zn-ribbon protein